VSGQLEVVAAVDLRVGMIMRMGSGTRKQINWIGTTVAGAKSVTAVDTVTGVEDWWIFNRAQQVTVEAPGYDGPNCLCIYCSACSDTNAWGWKS